MEAIAQGRQNVVADILDVALPFFQRLQLALVEVEADNLMASFGEGDSEWQSDIAQSYNSDFHRAKCKERIGSWVVRVQ